MDYGDNEGYQSSGEHVEDDRSSSTETVSSMTPTKDGDYFEERYRVDRRKLEQMIQGNIHKQNSGVIRYSVIAEHPSISGVDD